jgi:hypothetical protein
LAGNRRLPSAIYVGVCVGELFSFFGAGAVFESYCAGNRKARHSKIQACMVASGGCGIIDVL